jgi:NADH:ubiquinone oxidoreductase subunit 5 (subunit L)/multisubunit Na+/H+ antiporter MnhA subunit
VIYALSELDGRRVLSWSTLENMGIIATGLGLALVAETLPEETGQPLMLLAMLGVLAHLLNHSLAKTTLLLGLGAVERACGTRKLDALGGLSWVMPRTSWAILVGSMALAGVPILNVFAGEWLLFSVAFQAAAMPGLVLVVGVILGLALISGLAVAVFTRFYGILFLGAPREGGRLTGQTADPGMAAAIPMVAAACCIALGIFPAAQGLLASRPLPVVFPGVIPGALPLTGLQWLTAVVVVFAGICLTGIWLLQKKLEERMVRQGPTWGCGYAHPSPRMQYTAASFSEPLLLLFGLNTRPVLDKVTELFPNPTATPPTVPAAPSVLEPLKLRAWAWVDQVRQLQHGRTQIYLSYVLATLLALFFWQLS